ncbi:MAG: efflux RND transporter periplasmic adaptor subunit [Candidatus Magnetobacterium sp. LHC-1]|nr:efflux RND transporter periplasmic adaptor subunit [Nitrospirota bacterium]
MAKHRIYFIAATIAMIVSAIVVYRYWGTQSTQASNVIEARLQQERHEEERHDESEKVVKLQEGDLKEFGIEVEEAGQGKLTVWLEFPGEITLNADRLVNIVPRVAGVVGSVSKNLGDYVQAGEGLAVIESKELADIKAAYLTALKRTEIAGTSLKREETLFKKNISPELDYLDAKKAFGEAQIELKSAQQKLQAIGFSDKYLAELPLQSGMTYTRYEMKAPFSGTVIEKHISLGSVLKDDAVAFVIADMSSIWVNISLYQRDMTSVRKGQPAVISPGNNIPDAKGTISYISHVTDQQARTATARVVLPNPKGVLRPGLFVTARLAVDEVSVLVLVPKTALVSEGGMTEVFVQTEKGFSPQAVTLGKGSDTHVEVVSGLRQGQKYVAKGGFTLKAQMSKGAFGDNH